MTAKGIDYNAYIDKITTKFDKALSATEHSSLLWPPFVRLTVYKQYLLPTLDYLGGILFEWAKLNPNNHKTIDRIDKINQRAVRWILSTKSHNVAHYMLNIPDIHRRFEELRCGLHLHLTKTPQDTPWRGIFEKLHTIKPKPFTPPAILFRVV